MIFCRSVNDVGMLHTGICSRLPIEERKLLSTFHSSTIDEVKNLLQTDMASSTGKIKILICTTAAGMGLNFASVNYVIHYGPPYTTDALIQQIGRAGRDGSQCFHLLLYSGRQKRGVDEEVLSYCTTSECRRNLLMSYYGGVTNSLIGHLCCDNCCANCTCAEANCKDLLTFPLISLEKDDEDEGVPCFKTLRSIDAVQSEQLEVKLSLLLTNPQCLNTIVNVDTIINTIISQANTIFIVDDVLDLWQTCCDTIEIDILAVFNDVFYIE